MITINIKLFLFQNYFCKILCCHIKIIIWQKRSVDSVDLLPVEAINLDLSHYREVSFDTWNIFDWKLFMVM